MAEAPQAPVQPEEVRVKGTFAGQAIDLAAKGATVVLLFAIGGVGYIGLREHHNITSAQQHFIDVANQQNELLHQQTAELRQEIDAIKCDLGVNIFVGQFPRGAIDWDLLPPQLHACYPEYVKKLPRPTR